MGFTEVLESSSGGVSVRGEVWGNVVSGALIVVGYDIGVGVNSESDGDVGGLL